MQEGEDPESAKVKTGKLSCGIGFAGGSFENPELRLHVLDLLLLDGKAIA